MQTIIRPIEQRFLSCKCSPSHQVADALCGPPFSAQWPFDLWPKIALPLPVTPDVDNISPKFERCMFSVLELIVGKRQTDGCNTKCGLLGEGRIMSDGTVFIPWMIAKNRNDKLQHFLQQPHRQWPVLVNAYRPTIIVCHVSVSCPSGVCKHDFCKKVSVPCTSCFSVSVMTSPDIAANGDRCCHLATSRAAVLITDTAHLTELYFPPTTEEVYVFARAPAFVCLSMCKITQKRVHGFGWNVACRQMSGYGRTD